MVDGLNLYEYVRNNPPKMIDPTGHSLIDVQRLMNAPTAQKIAYAELGLLKGAWNLAKGALKMATPIGPLIDAVTGEDIKMAKAQLEISQREGGGFGGFLSAMIETLNPAFTMLTGAYDTKEAWVKNDLPGITEGTAKTTVGAVGLVTTATGFAKVAPGVASRVRGVGGEANVLAEPGLAKSVVPEPGPAALVKASTPPAEPAPIIGKAQVTSPGHDVDVAQMANEGAMIPGIKEVHMNRAYSSMTGVKGTHTLRRPDVGLVSEEGALTGIERVSPTDTLVGRGSPSSIRRAIINRNLKAMLELGEKSEGLLITGHTSQQLAPLLRVLRRALGPH